MMEPIAKLKPRITSSQGGERIGNTKKQRRKSAVGYLFVALALAGLQIWWHLNDDAAFVPARSLSASALAAGSGVEYRRTDSARKAVTDNQGTARDAIVGNEGAVIPRSFLTQMWGAVGVAAYLSYGIKKVVPIVTEGVAAFTSPWQWCLLAGVVLFFAYYEGYKGFQKGFAPRVVSRAWAVSEQSQPNTGRMPLLHKMFAPAFCIGYFHGTKGRVIASWAVSLTIVMLVVGVKKIGNPTRAIIDAGVIVGLAWGVASILVIFTRSLITGKPPDYDPSLPKDTPYSKLR